MQGQRALLQNAGPYNENSLVGVPDEINTGEQFGSGEKVNVCHFPLGSVNAWNVRMPRCAQSRLSINAPVLHRSVCMLIPACMLSTHDTHWTIAPRTVSHTAASAPVNATSWGFAVPTHIPYWGVNDAATRTLAGVTEGAMHDGRACR